VILYLGQGSNNGNRSKLVYITAITSHGTTSFILEDYLDGYRVTAILIPSNYILDIIVIFATMHSGARSNGASCPYYGEILPLLTGAGITLNTCKQGINNLEKYS
jgi:hypothetical protein